MASEVQVCNNALTTIGEDSIVSLTDNSKAARLCNLQYEIQRDALLRQHLWNFAIERTSLPRLTTSPAFGFNNEFQLPSDFLRMVRTEFSDDIRPEKYRIEGRKLRTDSDTVKIEYIRKVIDPNEFDSLFIDLLASRLTVVLALPLTDSKSMLQNMSSLFVFKLSEARLADAQENGQDEFITNSWTGERI